MPLTPPKPFSSGRTLEELSKLLREDESSLREWLSGTPPRYWYNSFAIPKRSGKPRQIHAPNEELLALQRVINRRLLATEPLQDVVTGFVQYRSIVDNAKAHLSSQIIVKVDLKDFFTSIPSERIATFWRHVGWNAEATEVLTKICCFWGSLPQGAPTSPALSNLVNRGFDGALGRLANRYNARYTRYADDLTFSWPKKIGTARKRMHGLLGELIKIVADEGYMLQRAKGIKILRPHQRQIVTGLLVNEDLNLPRTTRHKIRGLRHLAKNGSLDDYGLRVLKGYELLEHMVNLGRSKPKAGVTYSKASPPVPTALTNVTIGVNIMGNGSGDFVLGDLAKAGDNFGGIQNVGKFKDVRNKLEASGKSELADAINSLLEAISRSSQLSVEEKREANSSINLIAEEYTKQEPSRARIKMLWAGVTALLQPAADVAQILSTVGPLIAAGAMMG